ncbi:hypothetical protein [Pseudobacteriovorax antillogorgiicola]|uniref:Uncharacterized protein n=1 Tax=Pseudobacteriovorax antillogorgiicola TaxID=1513793 RepID=A0A1Y6C3C2_9BACT|nr:hypothetical protein [Pseudobacteriovorax antillogorgiicola]TCS50283.1 hypothetical protein EDD56_113101 [Pseudobacteriovorax antillogorgiicola]SMF33836.1 hypothetical protein SAMN06296036_110100 [Pseudobacteriovorax antillogorgiicola]
MKRLISFIAFIAAAKLYAGNEQGGFGRSIEKIQVNSLEYKRIDLRLSVRETLVLHHRDLEVKKTDANEIVSLDERIKIVSSED